MLVVETIAKIRRAYFVQGKATKEICRELRVSRKVVRKAIRSEDTAFEYKRRAQPQPRIGPWRDALDRLLATNAARPSRERLSLMRIYEELSAFGYEGGCDASHANARGLERAAHAEFRDHPVSGEAFSIAPDIVEAWLLDEGAMLIGFER
jgi:hypothetical protein